MKGGAIIIIATIFCSIASYFAVKQGTDKPQTPSVEQLKIFSTRDSLREKIIVLQVPLWRLNSILSAMNKSQEPYDKVKSDIDIIVNQALPQLSDTSFKLIENGN